jgi:hypothetical protein
MRGARTTLCITVRRRDLCLERAIFQAKDTALPLGCRMRLRAKEEERLWGGGGGGVGLR